MKKKLIFYSLFCIVMLLILLFYQKYPLSEAIMRAIIFTAVYIGVHILSEKIK